MSKRTNPASATNGKRGGTPPKPSAALCRIYQQCLNWLDDDTRAARLSTAELEATFAAADELAYFVSGVLHDRGETKP